MQEMRVVCMSEQLLAELHLDSVFSFFLPCDFALHFFVLAAAPSARVLLLV